MKTKDENLKNSDKNQEKKTGAKETIAPCSKPTNDRTPIFFGFV